MRSPDTSLKPGWKLSVLLLVSCCFLFLAAQKLHLPGYQSDEGFYAVPAAQFLQDGRVGSEDWGAVDIGGLKLPVMRAPYFGATQVYLLVPFFKVFGADFIASRLLPIFLALLCIWLTWRLCEAFFNWRVALLAAALTGFNASYILWSRVGLLGEGPVLVFFSLLALELLAGWYFRGSRVLLCGAAFLLGLGLYTKINFLFILIGLFCAALVLRRELAARLRAGPVLLAAFFFLLGAGPLLYYNLTNDFPTMAAVLRSAAQPTWQGIDNWDLASNFSLRAKQFVSMLGGSAYYTAGVKTPNPLYAGVFLLAFLGLVAAAFSGKLPPARARGIKALLAMEAAVFACNCFTTGVFNNFHLYVLYPLPFVTIALFLDMAAARAGRYRPALLAALLAVITATDVNALFRKYAQMEETGESGEWSDAIYGLSAHLAAGGIRHPLIPDGAAFAMRYNVQLLTHGAVVPVLLSSLNGPVVPPGSRDSYLVTFVPPFGYREKRGSTNQDFLSMVKKGKSAPVHVKTFANRACEPIFNLYKFEAAR